MSLSKSFKFRVKYSFWRGLIVSKVFRLEILRWVDQLRSVGALWSLNLETVCTSVHGCIRTHWEDQSSGIRSGESKWTLEQRPARARVHARPISAYTEAAVRETGAVYTEFSTKRSRLLVVEHRGSSVQEQRERNGTTDLSNWFDRRTRGILSSPDRRPGQEDRNHRRYTRDSSRLTLQTQNYAGETKLVFSSRGVCDARCRFKLWQNVQSVEMLQI